MERKAENILENFLPSQIYFVILLNYKKMPLTGYKIATLVYGKNRFFLPHKVYEVLKKLEKENLIIVEKAEQKGKKVKIIKPNLLEFVKLLNEKRLPPNYRLNEEEIKILADFFEKVDWSKLYEIKPQNLSEEEEKFIEDEAKKIKNAANIFDAISLILKMAVLYREKIKEAKADENLILEILKNDTVFLNMSEIYMSKLPDSIYEKLKHLVIISEPLEALYNVILNSVETISQFCKIFSKLDANTISSMLPKTITPKEEQKN